MDQRAHETEDAHAAAVRALDSWRDAVTGKARKVLPFPWKELNATLGGMPLGKLLFFGGRSSEYKTTTLRTIAEYLAGLGHRSVYWTLEDSNEDIAARTIANVVKLTTRDLGAGAYNGRDRLDQAEADRIYNEAIARIAHAPWRDNLRLIDEAMPRLSRVLELMHAEAKLGAKFFALDYFQLVMPDRGEKSEQSVRHACASLAGFAKETGTVVAASSQIDKAGTLESQNDCRVPKAAEMLYGTVLFQTAHGVLMLGASTNQLEIFVEKFKSGPKGVRMHLGVDPAYDRLDEI